MIQVSNLSRSFESFKAVEDISFSIKKGEIVGLLGPNGAGKTTTMRMITGFLKQTSGSVLIDGMDTLLHPEEIKRKIGYMPESSPLYQDMMVYDYLCYVAKMQGLDPLCKVPELAKICGLEDVMHKDIWSLSKGYKQRVGLAHALMNDPEILILDEPTSGLDPNQISEVRSLIKEIGKTRTVIISTHILSEVEMICDRVIIISQGKIAADCAMKDLETLYSGKNVIEVEVSEVSFEDIEKKLFSIDGITSCLLNKTEENGHLFISVKSNLENDIRPSVVKSLVEINANVFFVNKVKKNIEDVFRLLTLGDSDENK